MLKHSDMRLNETEMPILGNGNSSFRMSTQERCSLFLHFCDQYYFRFIETVMGKWSLIPPL